jgi:phage N-6-adenine-methyltransferase
MALDVHFSSGKDDWETPQATFDALHAEFNFLLDVAANSINAKLPRFYAEKDDGLSRPWAKRNWCNPPYSDLASWIQKASAEQKLGNLTAMLIPARTDTRAFHAHVYNKPNVEIRFLKGRLKFVGAQHSAPFPSMVVIFQPSAAR